MPVVEFPLEDISRLFPDYDLSYLIDTLPFIGLDLEYRDDKSIRLEYSPNRPDFSTFYGIARALSGLLGKELGIPKFQVIEKKKNIINYELPITPHQIRNTQYAEKISSK